MHINIASKPVSLFVPVTPNLPLRLAQVAVLAAALTAAPVAPAGQAGLRVAGGQRGAPGEAAPHLPAGGPRAEAGAQPGAGLWSRGAGAGAGAGACRGSVRPAAGWAGVLPVPGRARHRSVARRMGRYRAMVEEELRARGLPESLVYLPIVDHNIMSFREVYLCGNTFKERSD